MPKNTASSSSCAMISASTAVVSIVPPEALLSQWSSRKTGPLSLASCLARATLSANGSDSKEKSEIGRAHVCTPVTNAHLVCRLLLETKNTPPTHPTPPPTTTPHPQP